MNSIRLLATACLTGCLMVVTQPAAAQLMDDWVAEQGYISRVDLEKLLNRLENTAVSPSYSADLRALARQQASDVLARLREGDFHVGDRLFLTVPGEPALTDTFVVEQQHTLTLPIIGSLNLYGVLRSELESHIRQYLGRYMRQPSVKAESFIRVTVLGAVPKPGFYSIRSEAPVTDVLMQAGGPTSRAVMDDIRVERGTERILEGEALQQALALGRTFDQLSLKGGDRLFIPERADAVRSAEGWVRTVSMVLSIPLTIFAVTQIF